VLCSQRGTGATDRRHCELEERAEHWRGYFGGVFKLYVVESHAAAHCWSSFSFRMVNEAAFGHLNCEFPPFEVIEWLNEDERNNKLSIMLSELATSVAKELNCRERLVTLGFTFVKYALAVALYVDDPKMHVGRLGTALNKQVSTSLSIRCLLQIKECITQLPNQGKISNRLNKS